MADRRLPDLDAVTIDAARSVVAKHGLAGLTIERLAEAAGTSRMTLHRRHITRRAVVDALQQRAAAEYATALWPALTSPSTGAERLSMALDAICVVADEHLALLAGLFAATESPFHVVDASSGNDAETHDLFVAPLARLLRDGAADGTLDHVDDPAETATVLFNVIGWGYVHLRHAQHWPIERARRAVVSLATAALRPGSRGEGLGDC